MYVCVCVWEHILAQLWRSVRECVDSLSWSITVSHSVVFRPSDCGWIRWKHLFIYSLSLSLSLLSLSPRLFLILLVHSSPIVPVRPGMCLRAWATSGHSLSTSATCLMTQRTSAWSGRRSASRRFLSKVYESLSLEESFFQEGEGFFLLGLANAVIWALRGLTAPFPSCVCVCHLFISMLLCHTAACGSLLSAHSFLMGMWQVKFLCFVYWHVSLLLCCRY